MSGVESDAVMSAMSRDNCPVCDAPLATEADEAEWQELDTEQVDTDNWRPDLCWSRISGDHGDRDPIDWRARALAAEAERDEAREMWRATGAERIDVAAQSLELAESKRLADMDDRLGRWIKKAAREAEHHTDSGRRVYCEGQAQAWRAALNALRSADPSGRGGMVSIDQALAIAKIAMKFGEVTRTTAHPDGRPETDTTHTIMLQMLVAHLARAEGCNVSIAVCFAFVHDLVETYADDTCTAWGLGLEEQAEKSAREAAALVRLKHELGEDSWVISMIERYNTQSDPEARLVHYVDKVTVKLTHIINGGLAIRAIGMTADEMASKHHDQCQVLEALHPELAATRELFKHAARRAEGVCRAAQGGDV